MRRCPRYRVNIMLNSLRGLAQSHRGLLSQLQQVRSLSQESKLQQQNVSLTSKQQRLLEKLLQLANQNKALMMQAGVPLPLSMLESLAFKFVSELTDEKIDEVGKSIIQDIQWILNESE